MRIFLLSTALCLGAASASADCDVIEGRWNTQPSLHRSVQSFAPTSSGATTARTLFERALSRLKTLVTLYHPTVWPHLTVSYVVDPASTEWRPVADLRMTFSFGPWGFQGAVPLQYSQCAATMTRAAVPVRRVQFDLRRANGDLTGVVSAMRINFTVTDTEGSPGYIGVSSTVGILPGSNYGNHGGEIEDFLRKQIYPFMDALRAHYANVREQAERIERLPEH